MALPTYEAVLIVRSETVHSSFSKFANTSVKDNRIFSIVTVMKKH